jgi:hypothetical protein
MMSEPRVKRSIQIPMLKAAALRLAEQYGQPGVISNIPVTDVKLSKVNFSLSSFGARTVLEVWAEERGGAKVLNLWIGPGDEIEVISFRRGEWETALLAKARQTYH